MESLPKVHTLILMRHAKSSWDDSSLDDHSRPLNGRGRRSAPLIAEWLIKKSLLPQVILCSSAIRTQETSALLRQYWGAADAANIIQYDCSELYMASPNQILDCLATRLASESATDLKDSPKCVLVLGHNPGSELLASMLSGEPMTMATAACVVFEIDCNIQKSWRLELAIGGIRKTDWIAPKLMVPE